MELVGKINGHTFIIKEKDDTVIINCNLNMYGIQEKIYHPLENITRRVKLTEGLFEAYLVLNHLKTLELFNIKLTKIPSEIIEMLDTRQVEEEVDGNVVF